ncbi:hypothetical protein Tco_0947586 [Tanacetum coccineum]
MKARDGGGANVRLHSAGLTPASTTNGDNLNTSTWLEVSVLSDVGLSVPPKRRCVCQLNSASCRVQSLLTSEIPVAVDDELLLQSTHMSSL